MFKIFNEEQLEKIEFSSRIAASPEDQEAAYRLRYDVYIAEQGKPYVDADHERRLLFDELDADGTTILVDLDGKIVGTVRANWLDSPAAASRYCSLFCIEQFSEISPAHIAVCSRLATSPKHRHQSVRSLLFNSIYLRGIERDTQLCFAACTKALGNIFRGYGFREYATPIDDPVAGPLHRFVLVLDDLKHLAVSKSPFYELALQKGVKSTERSWLRERLENTHLDICAPTNKNK